MSDVYKQSFAEFLMNSVVMFCTIYRVLKHLSPTPKIKISFLIEEKCGSQIFYKYHFPKLKSGSLNPNL
jgi:hypothetical protein